MKVILCDDELKYSEQLKEYITEYHRKTKTTIPEMDIYTSGEDIIGHRITGDIAFIDVELDGISGIHVAEFLQKQNEYMIIFIVTSFQEYLDEAMKIRVFRYLTKPVDKNRFFRNYKDALTSYLTLSVSLPIETKEGVELIAERDIIMVEASDRKIYVHTIQGSYISIHNMNHWREILNKSSFFQSHRSYIVNFHHVKRFDHFMIYMQEPEFRAYLTKRKYTEFKRAFFSYITNVEGHR